MPARLTETDVIPYEKRLDGDWGLALSEGSRFFEDRSAVQDSLLKIARKLQELAIPYAVVGGMALYRHGFRRFTEDVDLLVTPEGLKEIHDRLEGLGYVPPFTGSKQLRDTETGVRVEFLISGGYPGDGKPKSFAYPDPADVSIDIDGIHYVRVETLVDLKLASGMTGGAGRIKDFGDVVSLVKAINLPLDFAEKLNPYVRDRYVELWTDFKATDREP